MRNKALFGFMVCLMGVWAASGVDAGVVLRSAAEVTARPYHLTYGIKFSGGFYFSGQHHNHWGHRVWDNHYHRYHYWEPNLRVYYFYDAGRGGYYPVEAAVIHRR
jgi:hypothetical protein